MGRSIIRRVEELHMRMIRMLAGKREVVINHACKEIVKEVVREIEVVREVPQDKIVWMKRRRR